MKRGSASGQRGEALRRGRVGIVEAHVHRVRRQRRGIVLEELEERRAQIGARGLAAGIGIGLELVATRAGFRTS
jgi:hypothetical protein